MVGLVDCLANACKLHSIGTTDLGSISFHTCRQSASHIALGILTNYIRGDLANIADLPTEDVLTKLARGIDEVAEIIVFSGLLDLCHILLQLFDHIGIFLNIESLERGRG